MRLAMNVVRLMKDHFIDDRALAAKFGSETLQFDNAEPPPLQCCKAIGRLIVGLQHEVTLRIQRHSMRRRATLEAADAAFAERRVCAVARRIFLLITVSRREKTR
jgi:hypothetical protein